MLPFPCSGREKVTDNLNAVLKLPRASSQVSDFLFSSLLDSAFHPAHAVPPASLSISLCAAFVRTTDLDRGPLDPPAPKDATVPPHALALAPLSTQRTVRDEKHALFLPVAAHPPYSFGYVLLHNPTEASAWSAIDVFPRTFVTRFAFNTITHDIVCVTHAPSAGCLGMHAINVGPNGARETYMLSIPALEYSWDNLPTTALWSVANIQYPGPDPVKTEHFQGLAQAADRLSDRGALGPGAKPEPGELTPLSLDEAASPSIPPRVHAAALAAIAAAHFGTFYSPMMRIDFALGPASVTSSTTSEHFALPISAAERMRNRLADLYYASVLSVSADGWLWPSAQLHQRSTPMLGPATSDASDFLLAATPPATTPLATDAPEDASDHVVNDALSELTASGSESTLRAASSSSSAPDVLHAPQRNSGTPSRRERAMPHAKALDATAVPIAMPTGPVIPKPPRPIAKRIQPRPPGMHLTVVSTARGGGGDGGGGANRGTSPQLLVEREQRRIARRERNRLSAARSNERRRLMLQGLKTDIASQRQRASQLIERLRVVTEENTQLRQRVVNASSTAS